MENETRKKRARIFDRSGVKGRDEQKRLVDEAEGRRGGLGQVFSHVVRQTHLPRTIAAGCAGFLSWDERTRSIPARADLLLHGNAKKEDRTFADRGNSEKCTAVAEHAWPPFASNKRG